MKWNKCLESCPKTYEDISHAIVLYEYYNPRSNIRCHNWCEARWNGLEWRTDDIGISEKENIFDSPLYTPLMWAIVDKPQAGAIENFFPTGW